MPRWDACPLLPQLSISICKPARKILTMVNQPLGALLTLLILSSSTMPKTSSQPKSRCLQNWTAWRANILSESDRLQWDQKDTKYEMARRWTVNLHNMIGPITQFPKSLSVRETFKRMEDAYLEKTKLMESIHFLQIAQQRATESLDAWHKRVKVMYIRCEPNHPFNHDTNLVDKFTLGLHKRSVVSKLMEFQPRCFNDTLQLAVLLDEMEKQILQKRIPLDPAIQKAYNAQVRDYRHPQGALMRRSQGMWSRVALHLQPPGQPPPPPRISDFLWQTPKQHLWQPLERPVIMTTAEIEYPQYPSTQEPRAGSITSSQQTNLVYSPQQLLLINDMTQQNAPTSFPPVLPPRTSPVPLPAPRQSPMSLPVNFTYDQALPRQEPGHGSAFMVPKSLYPSQRTVTTIHNSTIVSPSTCPNTCPMSPNYIRPCEDGPNCKRQRMSSPVYMGSNSTCVQPIRPMPLLPLACPPSCSLTVSPLTAMEALSRAPSMPILSRQLQTTTKFPIYRHVPTRTKRAQHVPNQEPFQHVDIEEDVDVGQENPIPDEEVPQAGNNNGNEESNMEITILPDRQPSTSADNDNIASGTASQVNTVPPIRLLRLHEKVRIAAATQLPPKKRMATNLSYSPPLDLSRREAAQTMASMSDVGGAPPPNSPDDDITPESPCVIEIVPLMQPPWWQIPTDEDISPTRSSTTSANSDSPLQSFVSYEGPSNSN